MNNKKIFLISFIVPFINMVTYLIEYTIKLLKNPEQYLISTISENVGAILEFGIVPLLFVVTLIIPKKILKHKTEILHTLSLIFIFGWILILASLKITGYIEKFIF